MEQSQTNWIANDVPRDLYFRGKYHDMILPMTVLRRFDALLETNKKAGHVMNASFDESRPTIKDQVLRQVLYNTSSCTLRAHKACDTASSQHTAKKVG